MLLLVRSWIHRWREESLVDNMPKHKTLDCTLRKNTFCSEILQSGHISSASHTLLAEELLHPCVCVSLPNSSKPVLSHGLSNAIDLCSDQYWAVEQILIEETGVGGRMLLWAFSPVLFLNSLDFRYLVSIYGIKIAVWPFSMFSWNCTAQREAWFILPLKRF